MQVQYGSLPFKQQIAYFRNKANVPSERWADVWKNAHDRGFMVAGAMKTDLLADFRQAVDTAIADGKSLGWFKSQFNNIVQKHGWEHTGSPSWRAQVIYETNIRQSYTAGREQQIEQVKSRRPYGIYKHSGAEHPRHEHLSWNNLVLPLDDPWWDTHTPINGYGCKCKKFTASERDLKRLGLEVANQAPKVDTYEWVDKVTGEVHNVPKGIDPSFDYTPKSSTQLTEKTKQIVDKKPPLEERLTPRVVDHAFSTIKGVDAKGISALLAELDSPQVAAFEQVLKQHDIKTLVLKAGEINGSRKGRALGSEIEEYLQSGAEISHWNYTNRRPSRTNGFTSRSWNHVVVKAKAADNLNKIDIAALTESLAEAVRLGKTADRLWSFSAAANQAQGNPARAFATWAHEMGHQVYFKAGSPALLAELKGRASLTRYGGRNDDEWFAEHFAAWLLSPQALNQALPEAHQFISEVVEKAGTL